LKYIVRLNSKAFNPITRKVIAARLWEVEQCAWKGHDGSQDSEKVIWHCADVRIDDTPIRTLYTLPGEEAKPWEAEYFGICVRGQDNVVEIKTGK
jgi:hypothetical protein